MWRAAAAPSIGLIVHGSKFCAGLVARMERSVIRVSLSRITLRSIRATGATSRRRSANRWRSAGRRHAIEPESAQSWL